MCVPQIVTYTTVDKGMELNREQRYALGEPFSTGAATVGKNSHLQTM